MSGSKLKLRSRALVGGAALVAAALAMSGCSPAQDTNSSDTAKNATLTLAIPNVPGSLDSATLGLGAEAVLWASLYDTLLRIDEKGAYVPNAAESWKYSDDAKHLTLKLRDGLSFSNGKPADASSYVASLKFMMQNARSGPATKSIESVEAPDDKTVVINLKEPDPNLIDGLATYVGVIADPETLGDEKNALHPVESGPYTLDSSATVTGSVYVLKRRDDYWDAKNYPFETLTIKSIPDQQATFNALQAGEIDAGYAPTEQVDALKSAGFNAYNLVGQTVGNIIIADLNGEVVPALADVRVRRAINMAFDREGFVKNLLQGSGLPAGQKITPGGVGYVKELDDKYKFDVEGAKKLLAEAGYPNGFEVTMPSTFLSQAYEPTIGQALKEIGITVKWEVVQQQDLGSVWSSKKYPMGFWYDGGLAPARIFASNYRLGGEFNPWGHRTDELDKLLATAAVATEEDEAKQAWEAVNRYVVDNAYSAPIFFVATTTVTKPGIEFIGTVPPALVTTRLFKVSN